VFVYVLLGFLAVAYCFAVDCDEGWRETVLVAVLQADRFVAHRDGESVFELLVRFSYHQAGTLLTCVFSSAYTISTRRVMPKRTRNASMALSLFLSAVW